VDSPQHTFSDLDELRQVASEIRGATSLPALRERFDRLNELRREYAHDFDILLSISDLQNEAVERARILRAGASESVSFDDRLEGSNVHSRRTRTEPDPDAAEISPDVQRLDPKSWQRAIYIGLFFAVILFAAFFYLIQTARRLNLTEPAAPGQTAAAPNTSKNAPAQNASTATAAAPLTPTVRLYTDLIPGTVSIDEKKPEDLKDGELILNNLDPGQHSIKVTGNGGDAEFTYDVTEKEAPRIIGTPTASNVMAVLVSSEDGKARLVTNAENSAVSLDGNPAGQVGSDGLNISDLGKSDHLLQVTQGKDRQRFVLTYTSAPALTVYVKSDPNAGTVVVITKQDGAGVYINDKLYRRTTEAGQLRIPLKVGSYIIRVHKPGFIDPPPETVEVKKAEETAVNFRLDAVPQISTLEVKGALPGTMVYVDKDFAAAIGADGNANISNVKPGTHTIELRRDQALPKKFERAFKTGDVVLLSGPDVTLDKVVVENTTTPPPPSPTNASPASKPNYGMEVDGQQVRKGGGFVAYHVPKVPGHYSFAGQSHKSGFLKHGKLQWYAGYQDSQNYVLFTVDGKHAVIREVRDGKSAELAKIPFEVDPNTWIQVDLGVKPNSIDARIKTPETGWQDLGTVAASGRDFTQDKVGFYVPDKDEISVANFRFSTH
jgi:hypothetical protein